MPARRRTPRPRGPESIAAPRRADDHPTDPRWRRLKSWVLQRDHYKCIACGHFGGPASGFGMDHVTPRSECAVRGINPYDPANLAAIHHSKPCLTCAEAAAALGNKAGYCNAMKGSGSLERARQLIANRTGLTIYDVVPTAIQRPFTAPRTTITGPRNGNSGEREW